MELTQTIKWNKLTTRELTDEEKEVYGHVYDYMWEGPIPEDTQEVLVYTEDNKYIKEPYVFTDIWVNYGNDMGFEQIYTELGETIYWASFPKPPKLD